PYSLFVIFSPLLIVKFKFLDDNPLTRIFIAVIAFILPLVLSCCFSRKEKNLFEPTPPKNEPYSCYKEGSTLTETILSSNFCVFANFYNENEHAEPEVKFDFYERANEIEEIKELLRSNDVLILTGESGCGKSTLLNLMMNAHSFCKEKTPSEICEIMNEYESQFQVINKRFQYSFTTVKLDEKSNPLTVLIMDQLDDVPKETLKTFISSIVKQYKQGTLKLILTVESSKLTKLIEACSENTDLQTTTYVLSQDHLNFKTSNIDDNDENDPEASWWIEKLFNQMKDGTISFVEYQIANKLFLNYSNLKNGLFKKIVPDSNVKFTDFFTEYIKTTLSEYDNFNYIANLSILRLLSDNKKHHLKYAESMAFLNSDNKWIDFLKRENLIQQVKPGFFQTKHDKIGSLFGDVSRELLSGDTIDSIDTIKNDTSKYKDSIEFCKENYDKNNIITHKFVSILLVANFILNIVETILCLLHPETISWKPCVLRSLISITVFLGVLYMGNFYIYCLNISKNAWAYHLIGYLAMIIPAIYPFPDLTASFYTLEQMSPGSELIFPWLGLIIYGFANASIGIFYWLNSRRKKSNAGIWLAKKGKLFFGLGIFISAFVVFLGWQHAHSNQIIYICMLLYAGYSAFIALAIKNYVHCQSLPWQRLKIIMCHKKVK
ncbi:MAG: hypothetical protein MJ231_08520, partial [bacterium]|nr:hypothetical protein [bacterium]